MHRLNEIWSKVLRFRFCQTWKIEADEFLSSVVPSTPPAPAVAAMSDASFLVVCRSVPENNQHQLHRNSSTSGEENRLQNIGCFSREMFSGAPVQGIVCLVWLLLLLMLMMMMSCGGNFLLCTMQSFADQLRLVLAGHLVVFASDGEEEKIYKNEYRGWNRKVGKLKIFH